MGLLEARVKRLEESTPDFSVRGSEDPAEAASQSALLQLPGWKVRLHEGSLLHCASLTPQVNIPSSFIILH